MNNEKYCQSCSMPISAPDLAGTEKNGSKNEEYCVYCYKEGKFTNDCTLEEMIEQCVPHVVSAGAAPDENAAREFMMKIFPSLKRWKK